MKIRELLLFHHDLYQNLYLVHNLENTNPSPNSNPNNYLNDNYKEKLDSAANRRINYKGNEIKYNLEAEKVNYSNNKAIEELNNKYETNFEYGNYSRGILNENRPMTSLSENPNNNLILNRKENERLRDFDDTENRFSNPSRMNYIKDSKEDDDLIMSTINTKKELGDYQPHHQNQDNFGSKQRFHYSESENILRGEYHNNRFNNRDRKEFIDISSDNNTIGNTRERFKSILFYKIFLIRYKIYKIKSLKIF